MSDDDYHNEGGCSKKSAKDITDCLLQSPSALEALGCGILPALLPLMSQQAEGPIGSRWVTLFLVRMLHSHLTPPPWYPPFLIIYGPPSYGLYPMLGGFPYGQQDWSDHGTLRQSKSSLPGNPGCAPHISSSSQEDGGGLLASGSTLMVDDQEEVDSWQCLVDPFLS